MKNKHVAILALIEGEFISARKKFKSFNSSHEGYAVILEELDELWDEVKAKTGVKSHRRMAEEAIQVAAMGIRFLHDVIDEDELELLIAEIEKKQ